MDRKEYKRQWYLKNKEKRKEQMKEYRFENKEKIKKYRQTPEYKKSERIIKWKSQGIIFHDWDLLHEIYIQTTHCDVCKCLLNQCGKSRKCVDHDHSITDDNNVRNILCHCCNNKMR